MNDLERTRKDKPEDEPSRGPNLILFYSLIVLAMVVATVLAVIIVHPFLHRG